MQRNFLYLYIFILTFLGCEVDGLDKSWQDINTLMVFLSLSFLTISSITHYTSKRQSELPRKSEIFLFLFLIWSAGTFYYSVNPDFTIFAAMKCLGALALGLGLFLYLENIKQLNHIWLVSFVFAGIHATLGIIERFYTVFLFGDIIYVQHSSSLFVNDNFYSSYLILNIPVGVYLYFNYSSAFKKYLIGLGWIFSLVSLGLSGSQAAQLIAGMQITATILYFLKHKEPERAKLVGLATLVAFLIFFILVQLIPVGNAFWPKPEVSVPEVEGAWLFNHVEVRLRFWLGAWRIFCEHWLLGSGLGTYSSLYPFTGLLEIYETGVTSKIPPHAHNLYLQTAAETGSIGLGLFLISLIFLFKESKKLLIKRERKHHDFTFYLSLSVSGFLIHNISENNWLNSLFVYYFVFIVLSMGLLYRVNSNQINNKSVSLEKIYLLPTVSFVLLFIGLTLSNYYKYNQIMFYKLPFTQNQVDIEHEIRNTKLICSRCGWPYFLSGIVKLKEYTRIKNMGLLDEAQNEFSEALIRNPYRPKINMLQGDIYTLQGQKEDAKQSYKAAMKHPWYFLSALNKIKNIDKEK